jgi:hypothetical protein
MTRLEFWFQFNREAVLLLREPVVTPCDNFLTKKSKLGRNSSLLDLNCVIFGKFCVAFSEYMKFYVHTIKSRADQSTIHF